MDNTLYIYLSKLRIISKIPINGKLNICNNDLNIYNDTFINWVTRKINGDSRESSTKYVIELYKEIINFSDQMMYSISSDIDDSHKMKKMNMLISLTEKLKESLNGIQHLIGTYKYDIKITSMLECLEQDVILPQYRIIKNFIPSEYHTDLLNIP